MIRYLKQYKLLLFLTVLFTAISSLSYVFIAILLQQVMDIVDIGDMDGFIRIMLFSLAYFALMGVFMYLQSLFSKKFVCKIMKAVRSKTFIGIERHTIEDYSKNHTADYLSAITNDVKMIEDNYLLPLLQVIQYTIIFIASLAVMIYFDISKENFGRRSEKPPPHSCETRSTRSYFFGFERKRTRAAFHNGQIRKRLFPFSSVRL